MEKELVDLFEVFQKEMCCFCSTKNTSCCKHNIYFKNQDNIKHIYCLDYKVNKKHLSKKQIREAKLLDNDKMKYIVSLIK